MKKAIALMLAAVLVCMCFVACGKKGDLDGSYSCEIAGMKFSTLKFDGNKVTCTYHTTGNVSKGTYKLKDNKVICEYESGKGDTFEYDKDNDTLSLATMTWTKD
ncbi:MAG: hypothetical protein E7575_05640 [Ruminococcaceae bacterium]|nr:hypothetical protein [Oscillospiraceae bacterium]